MAEEDKDESPQVNTDETDEEAQDTSVAFDNDLDSEVNDFTIEEDDHVFMTMVHPVDPHHFVCASSTVSRRLAEVFAKNSKPKGLGMLCQCSYTHMPTSSVRQFSNPSQSTTYGTMLLNWSMSPHLDSTKSIR
jgi:hypothetical protein